MNPPTKRTFECGGLDDQRMPEMGFRTLMHNIIGFEIATLKVSTSLPAITARLDPPSSPSAMSEDVSFFAYIFDDSPECVDVHHPHPAGAFPSHLHPNIHLGIRLVQQSLTLFPKPLSRRSMMLCQNGATKRRPSPLFSTSHVSSSGAQSSMYVSNNFNR